MPLSGGMFLNNSCSASTPPAEEPMPTTGKVSVELTGFSFVIFVCL